MASDPYELECMRAELLGMEKPDKEEFLSRPKEKAEVEEEEVENEEAKNLESQEESLKQAGGKLDELNSILSRTQQKLNRFKRTACESFSSAFKGSFDKDTEKRKDENNSNQTETLENEQQNDDDDDNIKKTAAGTTNTIQSNLNNTKPLDMSLNIQKKMTSHLDKLDSLISKADQAELSMAHQNKQMKRALNK